MFLLTRLILELLVTTKTDGLKYLSMNSTKEDTPPILASSANARSSIVMLFKDQLSRFKVSCIACDEPPTAKLHRGFFFGK